MHVLEVTNRVAYGRFSQLINSDKVDCFNLVGESDVKTDGTLRVRFEQAGTCSPCILVLRNIEALAQTTQPLEGGKGV